MARLEKFRKGDRAEYLAQVFLSSLSFSNPIFRQEDYGIDFLCSLIEKDGQHLHPTHSFNVQIKSSTKNNYIDFEKKTAKDLSWIFEIQTPYFFGFVDTDTKCLSLFSTAPIFVAKALKLKGFSKIRLYYDLTEGHSVNWINHEFKKSVLCFDIGKPFLKIQFDDIKSETRIEELKKILHRVIEVEAENILYKNLNLPLIRWLHEYTTNIGGSKFGWHHLCQAEHKKLFKPNDILFNIGQMIIALSKSYELHGNDKMYRLTKELVHQLPFESIFKSYLINLDFVDEFGKPK